MVKLFPMVIELKPTASRTATVAGGEQLLGRRPGSEAAPRMATATRRPTQSQPPTSPPTRPRRAAGMETAFNRRGVVGSAAGRRPRRTTHMIFRGRTPAAAVPVDPPASQGGGHSGRPKSNTRASAQSCMANTLAKRLLPQATQ